VGLEALAAKDVRVVGLPGCAERMTAIRGQVRPKREALGAGLAPEIARVAGIPIHAHVARHARQTVNPPDDTGVADGPDPGGYGKHARAAREALGALRDCFRPR
jgi:uncharacterized protein YktB (UPF0637 family)